MQFENVCRHLGAVPAWKAQACLVLTKDKQFETFNLLIAEVFRWV